MTSSSTFPSEALQASTNESISLSRLPSKLPSQNPLQILDQVILSIMTQNNPELSSNENADDPQIGTANDEEDKMDRIIKTIDFLYGDDCTSLIEGALSILDQSNRHYHHGSSGPRRIAPVRLVRSASSNRQVLIVQGGSSYNDGAPTEYPCLLGIPYDKKATMLSDTNKSVGRHGYHCTCRSFHERSKRDSGFEICKHLLAARIAPTLQQSTDGNSNYYFEENLSENEYAQLMIRLYSFKLDTR